MKIYSFFLLNNDKQTTHLKTGDIHSLYLLSIVLVSNWVLFLNIFSIFADKR